MQWLGATLSIVTLAASAQGQSSVTLAWDPSPGGAIAGYRLYKGAASRTYTNVIAAGNATTATPSPAWSVAPPISLPSPLSAPMDWRATIPREVSYTVPLPTNSPAVHRADLAG